MNMRAIAFFGFATVLTMFVFQANPSWANYICPNGPGPGEYQVGMTQGGMGVAAVPVCEQQQSQAPQQPNGSPIDAATRVLERQVDESLKAEKRAYGELMDLVRRPFRKYGSGHWFVSPNNGPKSCEVHFRSAAGIIAIFRNSTVGAGLSFVGFNMPAPKTRKDVQVTFQQGDAAPQIVKAEYQSFLPNIGLLTILDASPTKEGFNAMPADATFRFTVDGGQTFTAAWHDSAKMRDRLRQCVQRSAMAAR